MLTQFSCCFVASSLTESDIAHKIEDISGSIGKRYVRCDEIGIPFGITIDYDSLNEPHTVTLRERDTKEQLRIPIDDVSYIIKNLCSEKSNWNQLYEKYPRFVRQNE